MQVSSLKTAGMDGSCCCNRDLLHLCLFLYRPGQTSLPLLSRCVVLGEETWVWPRTLLHLAVMEGLLFVLSPGFYPSAGRLSQSVKLACACILAHSWVLQMSTIPYTTYSGVQGALVNLVSLSIIKVLCLIQKTKKFEGMRDPTHHKLNR